MTPNEARIHRWHAHSVRKWKRRNRAGIVIVTLASTSAGMMTLWIDVWLVLFSVAFVMGIFFLVTGQIFVWRDERDDIRMRCGKEPPRTA